MSGVDVAVIPAAGLGSRLGLDTPKGLVKIGDKTLIQRQIELLKDISEIRIVVGFKEEEITEHILSIRDDIKIVRNPNYASTTILQSQYLGVQGIEGPFICLEADVLFQPEAFAEFIATARNSEPGLLAIAPCSTDEPVCIDTVEHDNGDITIKKFRRLPRTKYEWTGTALLDSSWPQYKSTFVYEELAQHLPLKAMVVPGFEVDTPEDMARAQHALKTGEWIYGEQSFAYSFKSEING